MNVFNLIGHIGIYKNKIDIYMIYDKYDIYIYDIIWHIKYKICKIYIKYTYIFYIYVIYMLYNTCHKQ